MSHSAELLKQLRIERQSAPPPSRRWLWGVALLVLAAAAVAGFFWYRAQTAAIAVETAIAQPLDNPASSSSASVLDASGYVVARRMATVSAKVPGRVLEVLIEEGQQVSEGQVLARLDPVDAAQHQALARAQLAASQSQLAGLETQLREAEANASRYRELAGQQLASRAQYEAAQTQRDTLRAQLASQRRQNEVSQRQLAIANQGLDNTVVRAPFAGVVIAKAAQPGEIVSPMAAGGGFTRTGIGTIVDMDSLEVEVDVNEAHIGRVAPGMPVEAILNAYPDWRIPAEVIAIIPTADRSKATVKVRIRLNVRDTRIVPDMGVKVSFLEKPATPDSPRREGVLLPESALRKDGEAAYVFRVDGEQRVHKVPVQTAATSGAGHIHVSQGLAAGDTVVLNAPAGLEDGMKIQSPR
ncbi:efflux transporter periplasmic adaptor subunit [Lysobacteraceae bacterium NML95-0200]|nr:efflux transporter periplasmic adaptor subunit [Xanthomonadaceae bacterium NML95-0200]